MKKLEDISHEDEKDKWDFDNRKWDPAGPFKLWKLKYTFPPLMSFYTAYKCVKTDKGSHSHYLLAFMEAGASEFAKLAGVLVERGLLQRDPSSFFGEISGFLFGLFFYSFGSCAANHTIINDYFGH